MTTEQIKTLHDDWLRSFEVPPGLDDWSRRIREHIRDQMIAQRAGWKVLNRPDFGWTMATRFATTDWQTDLLADEPYLWIRHAARLLERPGMEHGNDPDLLAVHQAMRFDDQPEIRLLLNAALLAFDATVERVADAITFPVRPVEAYATLFFDVLDRKDDPAFLHAALRAGSVAQRWMKIPDHIDPAEAPLLLTGLRGTVAEVVGMYRSGGVVAA